MSNLKKEILVAVSGSIAAYKTCELVRNLTKEGYPVSVIMTANATKFVGPITFEALTGKKVRVDEYEQGMAHIDAKNSASVIAIVPATANIIGKMANGIADDLVTSTYLAANCPVVIAPAMNPFMYAHPSVQRNLKRLIEDGVILVDPSEGIVVCGDEGYGKLAEISIIQKMILDLYQRNF
ncbi:phosphopantothenoylcysteine decarboxylase [Leptospira interrogans]|uniref:phosphopantothenoylcysteine decarboxylase n=1 Tax=Leptospira interrogans TaxID=173 RepID=UPI0010BFBC7A|nr:phosphopantothenoylcysteine decarboxylase [Leptospira interrogans]KAA1268982.1 phosphopantothenoylcysteine decarboxylase [Leptospira interrogans serovar Weerasinghe]KAA1291024.1 phosphopantothenoylcysteine decarboxylase [Leptospira interrogans serovar Geyaweera]QCO38631.1 phosphopantothenoylcysteine decarboxylase [Leptospira interrogans]ULG81087.1 phosphopantothenoylcysteine decarboxylase [Leptospira interrogans]ULG91519.1 phosphopantothenoylcysteine decarboxylase [Leptospira interrogans]